MIPPFGMKRPFAFGIQPSQCGYTVSQSHIDSHNERMRVLTKDNYFVVLQFTKLFKLNAGSILWLFNEFLSVFPHDLYSF